MKYKQQIEMIKKVVKLKHLKVMLKHFSTILVLNYSFKFHGTYY